MGRYVVDLEEVTPSQTGLVGPKAATLATLAQTDGIDVPAGFCVTTDAWARALDDAGSRTGLAVPPDVAREITQALERLGESPDSAFAVRSSATAEDLPSASSAGQYASYLDVVGSTAVLAHVARCWASLMTERAVAYRRRDGGDERGVRMAVIVQRMVAARVAGVLFTADPASGDRTVSRVEAVAGLGDRLVAGRAMPDAYAVRGEEVRATPASGSAPLLTDHQAGALAQLGRHIEARLGRSQDIEWCLDDAGFQIVQSRPITTLFPLPAAPDDGHRVYVSVGHQQMFTDAMTPLGLSVWQLTTPRPMAEAGSRLFVDVTAILASAATRDGLVDGLGRSDPLIGDALRTVLDRGFVAPIAADDPGAAQPASVPGLQPPQPIATDPAIVTGLIDVSRASLVTLTQEIAALHGVALLDFVLADFAELRRSLFDPQGLQVILAAADAARQLEQRLGEWLGQTGLVDALTQSVPHNVTAEMGLALLDVADAIRPHPEVVACLEAAQDDGFLHRLPALPGGPAAREVIEAFLHTYGARCVGEIDIARPRWSERPATLLPLVLANVRNFGPGEGARRLQRGRVLAAVTETAILARLRDLTGGEQEAQEVRALIERLRTFTGYREYPKYGMVRRYAVYKRALLEEADRLVASGVLADREEIFLLRLPELRDVVQTGHADRELIQGRREALHADRVRVPPRVFTSDGEVIAGEYRRDDVPDGALAGLAVSAGVVEGRARVVREIADADLEAGDILITPYTDPSWTPVFLTIAGLVTEVGGLMTHGAVIAREYGLPAVVGVRDATRLIADGRRIRLDAAAGWVQLLD